MREWPGVERLPDALMMNATDAPSVLALAAGIRE